MFNPETIDENVRKTLYDYDIKEIPLYKNQAGYWRDPKIIDNFWQIPATKVQTLQPGQILYYQTRRQPLPTLQRQPCQTLQLGQILHYQTRRQLLELPR